MRPGAVIAVVAAVLVTGLAYSTPTTAAAAALTCRPSGNEIDLNGDGFDDAVVGNPFATVNGKAEAGSITVLFGGADGRIGEGVRRVLTQASFAGSSVEAGDHFGWSVAIDEVDVQQRGPTPCPSILVGSPGEDWSGRADAGIAQLITFGVDAQGQPSTPTAQTFSQATMGGAVGAGDQFGYSVALGDANGTDAGIFGVGAPGTDIGTAQEAGAVDTWALGHFYETYQGKDASPGTPQSGDRFGAALAVGLLNTPNTHGTLSPDWAFLIGAPGDTVSGHVGAGSVTLFTASRDAYVYTQDSPGVPGAAESGDYFGSSLAVGQPLGTAAARRDIAVGVPGEDVGAVVDAGLVTMFTSRSTGLVGGQALTQATAGVEGTPERGDRFGRAVALRPAGPGDPVTRLIVGVPFEDVGSVADAGFVQTFALNGDDLRPAASYTESSAGTPGSVEDGNRFGFTVAAMQGVHEDVQTFSSPEQGVGSVFVSAVDHAGRASTRAWVPGHDGIPSVTTGRFGWSVGGLQSGPG